MDKSGAYRFIETAWDFEKTKSYDRLNSIMYQSVLLAIEAQMRFEKNDFVDICNKCNGGYWFGCNTNGKGYGSGFYIQAKSFNNSSALQSYEQFAGIKPFIHKNKRIVFNDYLQDNNYIYEVTGFNENNQITLVAYKRNGYPGKWQQSKKKGKRKLFQFDNKEWLIFRKTINEY